jgi:hypothetical protein
VSTKIVSVTLLRSALMAQNPDAKIAATILSVSFMAYPVLAGAKAYHRGPLRGQGTPLAALCRLWPHALCRVGRGRPEGENSSVLTILVPMMRMIVAARAPAHLSIAGAVALARFA